MALRLDRARAKVTGLMSDTCRVFRDPDGNDSDVLDPDTLELVAPDPAGTNVYAGPCRVIPLGTGRSTGFETVLGDADVVIGSYKVVLPFDAPVVLRNDRVVIIDSADFQLRRMSLRVLEAEKTSTLVQRALVCQVVG